MILKLLTSFVLWFYTFILSLFQYEDYTIKKKSLEYDVDHRLIDDDFNTEWTKEATNWNLDEDVENYEIEDASYDVLNNVPNCIIKTILTIKYYYNNKIYKVKTYNPKFKFNNNNMFSFSLPIKTAVLIDHDDKPMRDVTNKIKKAAGPKNNFHGEKILLKDIFYYCDEQIIEDYPKIRITNVCNQSKILSLIDNYTTDLHL